MVNHPRKPGMMTRLTGALYALRGMSPSQWFDRHEQDAAGKDRPNHPYDQVAAVYSCVEMRANALAMMPLRVSTANEQVIEDGPIVRLLACPNSRQTRRDFIRAISATLDLAGKVHLVFLESDTDLPLEVIVAHPIQMRAKRDVHTGEAVAWHFRPAGSQSGRRIVLKPDQVHTIINPDYDNPTNIDACVSPLAAVQLAVSQYYKADLANEASLDNNVEPGGVFTMDGRPNEGQIEDVKGQLRERQGTRNRRRALVLYGGMKWESIAAAFNEMEFAELKRMSRQDICAGFGLHQLLVFPSDEGLSSGAMDDAEEIAWTTTHLARAEWIAEQITIGIIARFAKDSRRSTVDPRRRAMLGTERHYAIRSGAQQRALAFDLPMYAWFDPSKVPAVIRRVAKQVEALVKLVGVGVPLNQAAEMLGIPMEDLPWGNTYYKPRGLVDVQEEREFIEAVNTKPSPQETETPEVPDDDSKEPAPVDKSRRIESTRPGQTRRMSESDLLAFWQSWRDSVEDAEEMFYGPYRRYIMDQRSASGRNLNRVLPEITDVATLAQGPTRAAAYHWIDIAGDMPVNREAVHRLSDQQRDIIGQIIFNITDATQDLNKKVGPVLEASIQMGVEQSLDEAATAQGLERADLGAFDLDDPGVADALLRRDVRLANLASDQADRLRATLAQGLEAGEGHQALANRIKKQFNLETSRARTVTFQEVGTAIEDARQVGRVQAGVPLKSWLWSRKETGRAAHQATEQATLGEPIPVDQDFAIGLTGITAPHPRGSGVAEQDINCGCTTLSRFPGDGVRELNMIQTLATRGVVTIAQIEKRKKETV